MKDSGIYTPGFCQAVFDVWQTAYNSNSREFTCEDLSLENLWRDTFAASSREEDDAKILTGIQLSIDRASVALAAIPDD